MADSDDEEHYTLPLKDQRYFGAGIKRKRVAFVPSSAASTCATAAPNPSALSASEHYLSIVFPKSNPASPSSQATTAAEEKEDQSRVCDVCKAPVDGKDVAQHASTLAHQVCLPHAHPPSALDRNRKGMTILQAYGWDPDQRRGLGAQEEGILHPVKAKEKRNTLGLGLGTEEQASSKKKRKDQPKPVQKLDAAKIRKLDKEQKKKDERLRIMFYANEDVDRYLGGA